MPFITGIGWISPQGLGRGGNHIPFQMEPGTLPALSRKTVFKAPYARFNRMDKFSRLGVSAMALALRDASLDKWTDKRSVGIVVGTVYGCLRTDLDYHETMLPKKGKFASPALFSYTLPNCFLGEAAACFGLTGPGYVLSLRNSTGLSSVKAALEDMDGMGIETAIAGICDLGCPSGFPLDLDITPGAVFMTLESTKRDETNPYGEIRLDRSQEIRFNGEPVSDLISLVEKCLKEKRT